MEVARAEMTRRPQESTYFLSFCVSSDGAIVASPLWPDYYPVVVEMNPNREQVCGNHRKYHGMLVLHLNKSSPVLARNTTSLDGDPQFLFAN